MLLSIKLTRLCLTHNTYLVRFVRNSQPDSMASRTAMAELGPTTSSKQSAHPRSVSSPRKPATKSKSSQVTYSATPKAGPAEVEYHSNNREKPRHKFSCVPDIVGGLRYTEYTTSRMLAECEPPFTVYSLGVASPNQVDRHHVMSQRIDDIMMPFKTEPHRGTTRAESVATGYPQALSEDVDEALALDSQTA